MNFRPLDMLSYLLFATIMFAPSLVFAETAPYITTMDKISTGDTAWILTSTALVLLMTIPGLALFYSGMVRKKGVLAVMAQSAAATAIIFQIVMPLSQPLFRGGSYARAPTVQGQVITHANH